MRKKRKKEKWRCTSTGKLEIVAVREVF